MSLTAVLKRMERGNLTAHGFRLTFRDWASETTAYPQEVCEMALAHTIANKVEAAYRRGDLFDKLSCTSQQNRSKRFRQKCRHPLYQRPSLLGAGFEAVAPKIKHQNWRIVSPHESLRSNNGLRTMRCFGGVDH